MVSGDDALARALVGDYLAFVEADLVTTVESLPIGGILPPAAPVAAGLPCAAALAATVRSLTPEEVGCCASPKTN